MALLLIFNAVRLSNDMLIILGLDEDKYLLKSVSPRQQKSDLNPEELWGLL